MLAPRYEWSDEPFFSPHEEQACLLTLRRSWLPNATLELVTIDVEEPTHNQVPLALDWIPSRSSTPDGLWF